jgi:hypothetical protein
LRTLVRAAAKRLHEQQATFTYRELLREVCEASESSRYHGRTLDRKLRAVAAESPDIRRLGALQREEHFCTKAMWALEKRLLGTAERMVRGDAGAVVPREIRERFWPGIPICLRSRRRLCVH